MRWLANENFPAKAIEALRQNGDDVVWIRESHPGATDAMILNLAVIDNRILLTFDKDLGSLAFKSKLAASSGIVLFRIRKQSPERVAGRALAVLAGRADWAGHFSVIEEDRVRTTPLPS